MLKDFHSENDEYPIKITSNFHTHNYLCGHAGGTVCDYVKEAVDNGFEVIGISDHCTPPIDIYQQGVSPKTLSTLYLPQFDEAQALYGDRIEILKGVEIEYFDGFDDYYEKLLSKLDYLVLGEHIFEHNGAVMDSYFENDEKSIISYCHNVTLGLKSGYFAMLAHPDLIFYTRPPLTKRIIAAFECIIKQAVECDIPLELNANGIRYHQFRYPTDLLIELCKKHDAKVIISSDCHSPADLVDDCMRDLYKYAAREKLNLVRYPKLTSHK